MTYSTASGLEVSRRLGYPARVFLPCCYCLGTENAAYFEKAFDPLTPFPAPVFSGFLAFAAHDVFAYLLSDECRHGVHFRLAIPTLDRFF
jgi:hypothetical protein